MSQSRHPHVPATECPSSLCPEPGARGTDLPGSKARAAREDSPNPGHVAQRPRQTLPGALPTSHRVPIQARAQVTPYPRPKARQGGGAGTGACSWAHTWWQPQWLWPQVGASTFIGAGGKPQPPFPRSWRHSDMAPGLSPGKQDQAKAATWQTPPTKHRPGLAAQRPWGGGNQPLQTPHTFMGSVPRHSPLPPPLPAPVHQPCPFSPHRRLH